MTQEVSAFVVFVAEIRQGFSQILSILQLLPWPTLDFRSKEIIKGTGFKQLKGEVPIEGSWDRVEQKEGTLRGVWRECTIPGNAASSIKPFWFSQGGNSLYAYSIDHFMDVQRRFVLDASHVFVLVGLSQFHHEGGELGIVILNVEQVGPMHVLV